MEKGTYTKHFNTGDTEKDIILSFDAYSEECDNYYIANKLCNKSGFQVVEDRKEHKDFEFEYNSHSVWGIKKYFNHLLFSFYNIYGQRVRESLLVHFDFDNSTITVNGNTMRVEEDIKGEYTYKVLKTKIKAKDGIKGFYKYILGAMHVGSPFNTMTYNILKKIGKIEE